MFIYYSLIIIHLSNSQKENNQVTSLKKLSFFIFFPISPARSHPRVKACVGGLDESHREKRLIRMLPKSIRRWAASLMMARLQAAYPPGEKADIILVLCVYVSVRESRKWGDCFTFIKPTLPINCNQLWPLVLLACVLGCYWGCAPRWISLST